jgi:lysophospholipase L1-like esterase
LTPYDSEAIIYQFKVRTETVPAGAYKARYHSAIDAEKEPYAICIDNKGEAEDILWKNIVQVYNLLYSKIGATIDGYINSSTGEIVANNYWKTSEPFFVYEDMTLEVYNKISDENPILAYYDKDGNYLSALTPYDAEAVSTEFKARVLTVPAGAYMARYHSANDANDTPFALCLDNKGKTLGELWQTLSSKTDGFDRQLTIIPTHSGYINKNTGEIVPTNSWKHSGMFPVAPGSVYTLYSRTSSAVTLIAYYDSDGRYLKDLSPVSQSEGSQYETNNVTIPECASYAMFHSSSDTGKTPTCKLKDGSILENAYQTGSSAVLEKYDFRTTLKAPLVLTGDIDMVFFGDSITYGVASTEPTEENPYGLITPCENPYAKVLCSNLNIPYRSWNNKAVSGSRFAGTWDGINSITSKILEFSSSADIIYIAGGTNDYATGSTIGTQTDDTEDTLYGALNLICAYLKANYSSSTVIFSLPINMSKSQDNSVSLNQYREVIYEVAVSNGFYVVDCSEIGFPQKITANGTPEFKKTMIYDGIHPTEHGHKVMGDVLSYILNGCRV